ncbi:cell wall hydrolase, partial [Escherichia coli]|nr:cell wall hydrolase [Escherichia coli]
VAFSSRDHECLARAMYFESNRSSREGMVAVGSVVMNRVRSGNWGNTVCQVVGAPQQFAPGVLTRSMDSSGAPLAMEAARSVLKGERHPRIYDQVMYFHTAGYRFGYDNMHYVAVAGGNSFYEKRRRQRGRPNTPQSAVMALASSPIRAASAAVDPVKKVLRKPAQAVKRILPISEEVEQAAAPARNAAQPAYAGEPNASRFESAF